MSEDISPVYYCDSCSVARASYLIKLLDGELAFCTHHYNKSKKALDEKAYEVVELNKTEESPKLTEMAE
jgi:hypothetical protein